ncbi:MAG TPA: cytochrome c [Burkholderiales bacterium]|nr:cytochrome c [Burkholderiales bacterium]
MTNEQPMASWRWLSIAVLATIAGIWVALPAAANAAGSDAAAGQQLFQEKGCTTCHTVGKGPLIGPDLAGVTTKRPHEWLQQWIAAPDAMLAKKDPYAVSLMHQFHDMPMPNLSLSPSDVDAILAYLATAASGAPAQTSASAAAPAVQGNPEIGKELFTGVVRFQNGGPPCMACHSIGGIGALGGGQLGPDLTEVVGQLGGAAGLNAFIAGTPTPTMKAVWSQRPPTTEERANVVAFLTQAAVTQRPVQAIWQLAGLAALGVVILLAIAAVRWRNRLRFGVRRPMMAKPTTGGRDPRNGGWFTGPYHPGWQARFRSER